MTEFRALMAQMAAELDHNRRCLLDDATLTHPLADRARYLLAEPADGPPAGAEGEDISELFYRHCCEVGDEGVGIVAEDAPAFARAVLARWGQPPAPPPDGEVAELVLMLHHAGDALRLHCVSGTAKACDRAAELLGRNVAPVPVAVAERLPGREDCDEEGYCWRWNLIAGSWTRQPVSRRWYEFESHWLPANSLPLPAPQGGEVG